MSSLRKEDLEFVRDARAALRGERVPGANLLLAGIIAAVVVGVLWASQATIDEVTKGIGKVIPSSSIQTIQNLEGGILAELLVSEGNSVKEGQIVARIDDTMSTASFRENQAQRDALEAMGCRLEAEANELPEIKFTERILQNRNDLVASETRLFEKRRAEIAARREVAEKSLHLASEELAMTIPMVERQVAPKVDQLRLEREVNELKGKLHDLQEEFQRAAMEALNDTRAKLQVVDEIVRGREDRVNRAIVRSPVNGTINKIHIKTVGGVIQPGEPIMDIVPIDGQLLVEAKIRPSDIAFLRPGQESTIKFTAYDFSMFGGLKGVVEHISADTIRDEVDEEHYYQIKVRNTQGALLKNGKELPIIPGMITEVDVLTGRRTVLQYLLKPFHRARFNSLRER